MTNQAQKTLETPFLRIFDGPPLQWYCLNDIVMGGRSSSQLQLSADAMIFSGSISTQGGGFASCRTTKRDHQIAANVSGIWITVSGEHTHSVKLVIGAGSEADESDPTGATIGLDDLDAASKGKSKGKEGSTMAERWVAMTTEERRTFLHSISWQSTFSEHLAKVGSGDMEPRRIFLPLSSFSASVYGQRLPKLRSPDLGKLTSIGINVGIFDYDLKAKLDLYTDGPFKITLHDIEFETQGQRTAPHEGPRQPANQRDAPMQSDDQTADAKWRRQLTAQEYKVLRLKGTEPAGTGEYDQFHPPSGYFACKCCGNPLYTAEAKFESGCGWPSFDKCIENSIKMNVDVSFGMRRMEIVCARCDGHMGHVFEGEQKTETNERHCVNSLSVRYISDDLPASVRQERICEKLRKLIDP